MKLINRNSEIHAFLGTDKPTQIGVLHNRGSRARDAFSFEFAKDFLEQEPEKAVVLDPHLKPLEGEQYCVDSLPVFGLFQDASQDRWGRLLMERSLNQQKRAGTIDETARLNTSDFLLGVHDLFRVGALRLRLGNGVHYEAHDTSKAAPHFVHLRELEMACHHVEAGNDDEVDTWLRMLIAPGGSLGGARPKASVQHPDGRLWIAKFPSTRDTGNVGAWEAVAMTLADACELNVPDFEAETFASDSHTFMIERFDRNPDGGRIHFASAMTLTGRTDGQDHSYGASYLELVQILIQHGAKTEKDLHELWSRIVFNMLISNTDDHLRNHGFLLDANGWRLAPLYDVNPTPHGAQGLKLNVNEVDNSLDLHLALSVAGHFRLKPAQAQKRLGDMQSIVKQWETVATKLGVSRNEQTQMARAFALA